MSVDCLPLGSCKHLQSLEVQLTPDDYFQGTRQPENLKLYEEKTNKLRVTFANVKNFHSFNIIYIYFYIKLEFRIPQFHRSSR